MSTEQLIDLLNPILQALVSAVVVLIGVLATWLVAKINAVLSANLSASQKKLIDSLLATIVQGVAQEFSEAENQVKFRLAKERALAALAERGLHIDEQLLRTWIEAAYNEYKVTTTPLQLEAVPLVGEKVSGGTYANPPGDHDAQAVVARPILGQ